MRNALRAAAYTSAQQAGLLCGDRPGSVVLANMLQPDEHSAFARETFAQNVARGSLVRGPEDFGATRPEVIAPVFVAADASGKLRFTVDARYTNLFLQYVRCYFQTIWDLMRILSRNGYGYVFDFKAGYHHWLLAAQHWSDVGVQLDGVLYVHAALPFGISQAPQAFTQIMQIVYSPLRVLHLPTAAMIDDSAGGAAALPLACWRLAVHARLLAALGWVLGLSKSTLWPTRLFKFLGFIVNLSQGALLIPDKKLEQFQLLLDELQTSWDDKLVAHAAGKLASFAPALRLAPLLTRALRAEVLARTEGDVVPGSELVLGQTFWQFCRTHIAALHGREWAPAGVITVRLAIDTSKDYFVAFVLHRPAPHPMHSLAVVKPVPLQQHFDSVACVPRCWS